MCGIFGFVAKENKDPEIVLSGLKLLEYRGYDSWGVAVKSANSGILVDKHIGKIGNAKVKLPKSNLGIGHTRWATHGGVTDLNSHPHLDCAQHIAVVHNGIIENYLEIKEELIKKNHKFISETDTEVFPHLVEEYLKNNDFKNAVLLAFNKVRGLNAVVVLNSNTNEIAAAKTGSPLIIGVANDSLYISSDPTGIVKYTDKAIFLKDNQMVLLGKDLSLFSLPSGKELKIEYETLEKNAQDEGLGKFRHYMLKEIYEEPMVLEHIANTKKKEIEKLTLNIRSAFGTYFIGAGTAYFACLFGTYLFSKIAKVHINTTFASEFNYLEDFLTKKSLIVAFSQSGETIDIVEPLNRARVKGSKIFAVTNVKGSTIYRMSEGQILLEAGVEKAVASTKAYLAKLGVMLLLTYSSVNKFSEGKKLLQKCILEIKRILEKKNLDNIKKIASFLTTKEHIFIIGRGLSFPSALEAALKIREVSYIHAEGLAGGELKHGPIALISKGTPVIVFAPNDETYEAIMSNAMEVKARGAVIIGISFKNHSTFDYFIEVKDLKEASGIAQIVPIQLLAYFLAVNKNLDPDKPRNLAKSVTVK